MLRFSGPLDADVRTTVDRQSIGTQIAARAGESRSTEAFSYCGVSFSSHPCSTSMVFACLYHRVITYLSSLELTHHFHSPVF